MSSVYLYVVKVCGMFFICSMYRYEYLKIDIYFVFIGIGYDMINDFSINVWCCVVKCWFGEEEDKRYDVNLFGIIYCVKFFEWEDSCYFFDYEFVVFGVLLVFGLGNGVGNWICVYLMDSYGSLLILLRLLIMIFLWLWVSRGWFMGI